MQESDKIPMQKKSKFTGIILAVLVIALFAISLVSCTGLVPTHPPTVTPTSTTTATPTDTPSPTVTLTPSPVATNTPTIQERLNTLDEVTQVMLHKPVGEVVDFFLEIQDSIRTDNKEKLASLVSYPIMIYGFDGNNEKEIKNTTEFVSNYEKIVTAEWKDIVLGQEPHELHVNWQGVRVYRGELWFAAVCLDQSCQDTKLYIITINHTDW